MNLPQHFNIVAIADYHKGGADLAAAAVGILRNIEDVTYALYFVHLPISQRQNSVHLP